MHFDILIIGAGASGLLALQQLSTAGYRAAILEATDRAGGRIHMVYDDNNSPIEQGAEFIHGQAEITMSILKEAGIGYSPVKGDMVTIQNGVWMEDDNSGIQFDMLTEKLSTIKKDMTVDAFLDQHFPENEYSSMRKAVQQFAEGFSLADTSKASALAFKKEWEQIEEEQYRVDGGYGLLINYLREKCTQQSGVVIYNAAVIKVEHGNDHVIVYTADGKQYSATKLIVTIPAAMMQEGSVEFVPSLPSHETAFKQLGTGSVIKFLFQFRDAFWEKRSNDVSFFLSDEPIPTWWTQHPRKETLLTGWLGGPQAKQLQSSSANELLEIAIASLSSIFKIEASTIRNELREHRIICWDQHPYINGGYTYPTVGAEEAKKILQQPVNETIYFAGEAIYSGDSQGTVEAALSSAQLVVEQLMPRRRGKTPENIFAP